MFEIQLQELLNIDFQIPVCTCGIFNAHFQELLLLWNTKRTPLNSEKAKTLLKRGEPRCRDSILKLSVFLLAVSSLVSGECSGMLCFKQLAPFHG